MIDASARSPLSLKAALARRCPECNARPGRRCRDVTTTDARHRGLPRPHSARRVITPAQTDEGATA
jgi:hypothetical protein